MATKFRSQNEVVLVKMSDWQGLYINEELVCQAERVSFEDGITEIMKLEGSVSSYKRYSVDYGDEDKLNNFPKTLTELKNQVKLHT